MNFTVDANLTTIVTAFLVGLVSLLSTLIVNKHSLKRQIMQWEREDKKSEADRQQANQEKLLLSKKELENRLQEIYGNSIAALTTLLNYDSENMRVNSNYIQNVSDAHKWLSLILAYHYDKESEQYKQFVISFREIKYSYNKLNWVEQLRNQIIRIATEDPRLKNIY